MSRWEKCGASGDTVTGKQGLACPWNQRACRAGLGTLFVRSLAAPYVWPNSLLPPSFVSWNGRCVLKCLRPCAACAASNPLFPFLACLALLARHAFCARNFVVPFCHIINIAHGWFIFRHDERLVRRMTRNASLLEMDDVHA